MLGNVHEYVHDWYSPYADLGADAVAVDPFGVPTDGRRIMRGNSYYNHAGHTRSALRWGIEPDVRQDTAGFRPVRSLE
jgi:formylglycine-generating enzyme required for sulfatase activity